MIGIVLGLALLVFLAYKGYSIIWVAPVSAMVVALTGGLSLLPAYTDTYMRYFGLWRNFTVCGCVCHLSDCRILIPGG